MSRTSFTTTGTPARAGAASLAAGPISPRIRAEAARSAAFSLLRVICRPRTSPLRSSPDTRGAIETIPSTAKARIDFIAPPPALAGGGGT